MSDASSWSENHMRSTDVAVVEGETVVDSSVRCPERNDEEGDPTPVLPPEPEEEEMRMMITKKYGCLLPRKPPLISQDHERAFFDSADWALAMQGPHKQPGGLLEPKLQPSPQQQMRSRRSAYAPQSTLGDSSQSQGFNAGSSCSDTAQNDELCSSKNTNCEDVSLGEGDLPGRDADEAFGILEHSGN